MKNAKQKINWWFIIFLLTFIALIPLWVYLIANYSWIELANDKNEIGDALGGITNPIIGIGGIILTFIAFYVQYQFNKDQSARIDNETDERIKDKVKIDLEAKRNYFDKKFYQLLEIHNKNVENISIKTHEGTYKGRESFDKIIDELHITIALLNFYKENYEFYSSIKEAYKLVFHGILNQFDVNGDNNVSYLIKLFEISNKSIENKLNLSEELRKNGIKQIHLRFPDLNIIILKGHSSYLSIYFRFLFMFVKFVDDEDEIVISYKEKRNYLKILRSQMSNTEQMLLFYNWLSGYGESWLDHENQYLTNYRIIHNIYTKSLYPQISLKHLFDEYKTNMRNLHKKDYLFDEDSWGDEEEI